MLTDEQVLKDFYKDINKWVEEGCPAYADSGYTCFVGLCSNLVGYCFNIQYKYHGVLNIMHQQFVDAGLHGRMPFSNPDEYERETFHDMYENTKRLAWIKDHAQ